MKKISFISILVFVFTFSFVLIVHGWEYREWSFQEGASVITVAGQQVDAGSSVFIENYAPNKGRTMVPLRLIGEKALGAFVDWKRPESKDLYMVYAVPIESGGRQIVEVQMDINAKEALVTRWQLDTGSSEDGVKYSETKELDVPAMIRNGTTFAPLRFLTEIFFSEVDWDALRPMGQRIVTVRSRLGYIPEWISHWVRKKMDPSKKKLGSIIF